MHWPGRQSPSLSLPFPPLSCSNSVWMPFLMNYAVWHLINSRHTVVDHNLQSAWVDNSSLQLLAANWNPYGQGKNAASAIPSACPLSSDLPHQYCRDWWLQLLSLVLSYWTLLWLVREISNHNVWLVLLLFSNEMCTFYHQSTFGLLSSNICLGAQQMCL